MKNYDIEINKEMVLSTAHVKRETLNVFVKDNGIAHSEDDWSSRFSVNTCLEHYIEDEGLTLPEDLVKLLNIAKAYNCKWLVLDCDADIVDGLETFEW